MDPLTVRIPGELQAKLQKFCKRRSRSASDVVRDSLRRYLAAEQLRELRDELRPYAQAAGYFTDDDIFRDVS